MTADPENTETSPTASTPPDDRQTPCAARHTPPTKASSTKNLFEFLGSLVADANKTTNAQKLLNTSAAAISRVVLSIGLIIVACMTAVTAVSHYAGIGITISGGIVLATTGGAGLLTWTTRKIWKRKRHDSK
ncbi:hypothetical protein [Amycolatopsis sp. NPDC058986]|uniref:hypothetical protein n=1 Tax=unclassified Amycolatopsis TaxID=2618356 RepID=UPI00366F6904